MCSGSQIKILTNLGHLSLYARTVVAHTPQPCAIAGVAGSETFNQQRGERSAMKLWVDVDDLFFFARHSARPTGIQRLTGEIYLALMQCDPGRVGFVTHSDDPHQFDIVSWEDVRRVYLSMTGGANAVGLPLRDETKSVVTRDPPTRFSQLMDRLIQRRRQVSKIDSPVQSPRTTLQSVAQATDTLCTLGAPWHDAQYAERVRHLKHASGMQFAMLVHDLIPLLRPEFFERGRAPNFEHVLQGCLPMADVIFANSQSTAADVSAWAARRGIALRTVPRHIPIGTGFTRPAAAALPAPLVSGNFVLFVSTIEVRKNHLQAFRIWCRLLEDLPRERVPTLVFAGGWGWMVEDLKKAVESTDHLGGKLVVITSPDDATLVSLYQGCRFSLFLSHYEGWGLPVSDSLAFRKLCVASNRTSIPEAGGEYCLYVDPDDTTSAYRTIRRLIEHPAELAQLEASLRLNFKPVEWRKSAEEILRQTSTRRTAKEAA